MSCEGCLFEVVNTPEKAGVEMFRWEYLQPCHACMNTYNQPPEHFYTSVEKARELLAMREQESDDANTQL